MRRAEVGWLRTVLACRPPVTDFCLEACPVPGAPDAGASALRLRAPISTGPGAGEELAAIGEALDMVLGWLSAEGSDSCCARMSQMPNHRTQEIARRSADQRTMVDQKEGRNSVGALLTSIDSAPTTHSIRESVSASLGYSCSLVELFRWTRGFTALRLLRRRVCQRLPRGPALGRPRVGARS